MLYRTYQFHDDAIAPLRAVARWAMEGPWATWSSWGSTARQRTLAFWEMLSRFELSHTRPDFGIKTVRIGGENVPVREEIALALPFG